MGARNVVREGHADTDEAAAGDARSLEHFIHRVLEKSAHGRWLRERNLARRARTHPTGKIKQHQCNMIAIDVEADRETTVNDRLGNSAGDSEFMGPVAPCLGFVDEIDAPMPALAEIVAKEDLGLDYIAACMGEGIFEIQCRVE